jgi:hypothetical protein
MVFYTYLWLREDGTPYYAGKGSGNRAFRRGSPPTERVILQEHSSEQDAFEAEKQLISFYGRKDLGTGILRNMTDGGDGSSGFIPKFTPEWRRNIGLALKGRIISQTQRELQRIAMTGRILTEAHKESIRLSTKAACNTRDFRAAVSNRSRSVMNPMFGRTHSPEVRQRLSEAMKQRRASEKSIHQSA